MGLIRYKLINEGSKSESLKPFLCLANGNQILLYKKDDNPFENKSFKNYENKTVIIEGDFLEDIFIVEKISTEDNKEVEQKVVEEK